MAVVLTAVFFASLLGSLHCVGMCGPFALIATSGPQSNQSLAAPVLAYSLGRLVSYSLVGAAFGAFGQALNTGAAYSGWQQNATFVAGILMVVVGFVALARCLGFRISLPGTGEPWEDYCNWASAERIKCPPFTEP